MKRLQLIFVVLSGCFIWSSCSQAGKTEKMKTQKDAEQEFTGSLSAADSATVLDMSGKYMESLKAGKVDEALDLLYQIRNGVLVQLTQSKRAEMKKRFEYFPVIEYRMDYYSFSTQASNDVKYVIEFAKRKSENEPASTMSLMLNPIRVDGVWYLTIKDGNQRSKQSLNPVHDDAPAPAEIRLEK